MQDYPVRRNLAALLWDDYVSVLYLPVGKSILKLGLLNVGLARGALNLLHKHACLRIVVVYVQHL